MMSNVKQLFLLQNQDNYFLSKHNEWIDGTDLKELYKTPHRDIAVNHLFEVNAQDYTQRIHVLDCEVEGKNTPVIDPNIMPPPLPKKPDPVAESEDVNDDEQNGEGEFTSPEATTVDTSESSKEEVVEPQEELLVHEV